MRTREQRWIAIAGLTLVLSSGATSRFARADEYASDVYIQQSHGRVAPGTQAQKPAPESTTTPIQGAGSTAPVTCNAQNASSQACYTATQQARPGSR